MVVRESLSFTLNGLGREIPLKVGEKIYRPYKDHFGLPACSSREMGRVTRHRVPGENKVLGSLEEALRRVEISDGMCISFHHHLRNGDRVVNMVLDRIAELGIKDLKIAPSALFDVHDRIIDRIKDGTVTSIEGSLNGAVGRFVSSGVLPEPVILRSHSGRARAIQQGELDIDVAFLAVSACDPLGNANGRSGPSAFGPCGIMQADARFARKTVLITDNIVPFPCIPASIQGTDVDHIVTIDSIGDPAGILSGTLLLTEDPKGMATARSIMSVLEVADIVHDGMSFQAGSGGVSLYMTKLLGDKLKRDGIKASFAVGGTTKYLVDMLKNGTLQYLMDGQSFDPASVTSLRMDPRHVEMTVDQYANIHSGATFTEMEDVSFLSGTEVDIDFNVNVNTHSDGYLLHGIGGHQDVAFGSRLTFVTIPIRRKENPIIKDRVLSVTTPGSLIDVVVSDVGISFNDVTTTGDRRQRNEDLEIKSRSAGLNVISIDEMRKMALFGGKDLEARTGDVLVGMIEYIDGSILDTIFNVIG